MQRGDEAHGDEDLDIDKEHRETDEDFDRRDASQTDAEKEIGQANQEQDAEKALLLDALAGEKAPGLDPGDHDLIEVTAGARSEKNAEDTGGHEDGQE